MKLLRTLALAAAFVIPTPLLAATTATPDCCPDPSCCPNCPNCPSQR